MAITHKITPGLLQTIGWRFDVLETLTVAQNMRWELHMRIGIGAAYGGGESTVLSLLYRVSSKDPTVAGAYTEHTKTLTSADTTLVVNKFVRTRWTLRADRFSSKPGGRIEIWFSNRSTSTGPKLVFGEPTGIWLPDDPGVVATEGFSFATT